MTVDANSQPGLLGPSPSTQAVAFRSGHLCAIDATLPARRATVDATTLRKNARATAVDTKLPRVAGSGCRRVAVDATTLRKNARAAAVDAIPPRVVGSGLTPQMLGVAPAMMPVDATPQRGLLGPKPSTQAFVMFRSGHHCAIDATSKIAAFASHNVAASA